MGEVKLSDEKMKRLLGIDPSREVSRTTLMGILAIREALDEAGLENFVRENPEKRPRIVLLSGTTVGGMDVTERHFLTPGGTDDARFVSHHDCGSQTREMAVFFSLFADTATLSTACSAAANALMLGARLLESNEADIVVAGGAEALSLFHLNGFNSLMILDKSECRPFDRDRAGLNLGEGAAFVVLERTETAVARHARALGYLSGWGNACDAYHQTASSPEGNGATLAMRKALLSGKIESCEVDYINAHGTATPNNDASESAALRRVFGDNLPPVSSTKSYTGHTTSASGAIEAVICLLAMEHGFVPANLGWTNADEACIMPSKETTKKTLRHVLCNSFGFGGNDTSLLFSTAPAKEEEREEKFSDADIRIAARVEITDEAQLADIKQYVRPLEARRMGKLMKASLLTSLRALEEAGIEMPDAIITGTAQGCLDNSERLLLHLRDEGEELTPSPTLFMQSTHNTLGSSIAIRLGCHGYNVTYTDGADSLRNALRDAHLLLRSGRCKAVLVGCHDESTPLFRSLMEQAGGEVPPAIHSLSMVLVCGR